MSVLPRTISKNLKNTDYMPFQGALTSPFLQFWKEKRIFSILLLKFTCAIINNIYYHSFVFAPVSGNLWKNISSQKINSSSLWTSEQMKSICPKKVKKKDGWIFDLENHNREAIFLKQRTKMVSHRLLLRLQNLHQNLQHWRLDNGTSLRVPHSHS